jgi:hypothetical protein
VHRRRYERCIASYLLTPEERAGWIAKNSHSWKVEKEEWGYSSSSSSSSATTISSVTRDSTTGSTFQPWAVGEWKKKGIDVKERITAETQCMFKSLKAEKEREALKRRAGDLNSNHNHLKSSSSSSSSSGRFTLFGGGARYVEPKDVEVVEKHDDDNLMKHDGDESGGGGVLMRQHVGKGIYVEQVDRWFDVFEPKRFFIVDLESFQK